MHQPSSETINGTDVNLYSGHKVLIFANAECPICKKYAGSFKSMLQEGIPLYFVFPGEQSIAGIRELTAYDSIPDANVIIDESYEITRYLDAKVTPQVIILVDGVERYSGKIDNRFENLGSSKPKATIDYIRNALNSLNKNEILEEPSNKPVGCLIEPR